MSKNDFFQRVYSVVKTIPEGRVTTYGLIAKKLGTAKSSRTVGWALNACHNDSSIPRFTGWWGHDKKSRFNMPKKFKPISSVEGWQCSNPSILSLAVLRSSMDIFQSVGMETLRKKSVMLTGYLSFLLNKLPLKIITPSNEQKRGCQLSIRIKNNGRFVKISHNNMYSTQYLHMSKFEKGIKKGKKVLQGEVIGYVGSTGLATGPHVCFRFWRNGNQVDPYKQKDLPEGEPISPKHLNSFFYVKDKYILSLSD